MRHRSTRDAVTLVEVIFAIGVILIGLVGLLSILPLAGNRAADAMAMSESARFGDSVMKELQARKLLNRDGLATFAGASFSTTSAITSMGFCLDPLLVATQPTAYAQYDPSIFPMYAPTHDPFTNPSDTGAASWTTSQPRLPRVGLVSASFDTLELARLISENVDDLNAIRPDDRSLPVEIDGLQTDSGLAYGKRIPTGQFSWIATVNVLPGAEYASVSIVVLTKRDYQFEIPSATTSKPNENVQSERVVYVATETGFSGGSGGHVTLVGGQSIESDLRSGDWVMLSSTKPSGTVHRWYRVASAAQEATKKSYTSGTPAWYTGTDIDVWERLVVLDGPDWNFGFSDVSDDVTSAGDVSDNTYATIVPNVVSVTERVVRLNDL